MTYQNYLFYEHIYKATDKFLTKEEQQEFEKQLADTRITQPAVILSSLIWTEFLSKLGIEPIAVAGHSLGELTAFYKAGAFNNEILIKFAELRGGLDGGRRAFGRKHGEFILFKGQSRRIDRQSIGEYRYCQYQQSRSNVVSGGNKEIEKITELAKKENISGLPIKCLQCFSFFIHAECFE